MNDKAQKLYDLYLSQGLITEATSFDRFSSATSDQQEKLYELGKSKGLFESATVDDFKSAFQTQEELTPEMMETGQRETAPAYAMTEEKYAAEKKSAGESPLQDGASADVVEEPVVEEEPVTKEEDLSDIITPKLMGKEEQEVVPFLNYQFGDDGFKFETSGIGDAMVAKFVDDEGNVVSEQEFDLDPFLTSTEVSESKKLQEWMSSQRALMAEAGIVKRAEDKLVKFRDRKQISTTLEEFSKEQEAFVESNKGLIAENMKYQEDLDRYNAMVSEYNDANVYDAEAEAKIKSEAERLQVERDRLIGLEEGIKSTIEGYQKRSDLLKRSVGSFDKYMEDIDTPTGPIDATRKFIGGFYDNMIRGIGEWAAGESTFYVETALNALPVESYVSPEIIEQQRKEGLSDSQIKDEAIRTFKKELLPAVRTGMEEIIGSDTTEEYVKKIEGGEGTLNFILGSVLGSAKSTPIMALHLASALSPMPTGKGGKALTVAQRVKKAFTSPVSILSSKFMGAQVADALDQEMANSPAFEGVSENEKMLVKYPVAIVSGLLEDYGASSIVNKTGLPQKLTLEILKKMGKGASAKTFKEFAEKEIKSRVARGGITFVSGMLSEFETGGLQELATVSAKKIYSTIKEQEMFPEMDEQGNYVDSPKLLSMQMAGQILDAAAREAIGGGFFSTIPALSSALSNDYYFNSISDEQFELFNSLINTKEGKIGVINDLKNKITAGEITQEEGKRMLDDVNKIQAALNKIPSDYSAANKKKALSLIMRQDAIKRDVAGKDENLTKRQRAEIEKINQMLEDTDQQAFLEKERQDAIQEPSTETVDVQEPAEGSEEVGEGDVRETAEEKITVTEETKEVTEETLEDLENVPEPVIRGLAVKTLNGETLTEQEQQVFDAQQEAVEQMASDIEQGMQAEAEVGEQLRGETSAEDRSIIERQVNRAKRAISKILPDVEIVMHDTDDSFVKAAKGDERASGKAGMYDPNSDKIHINMSKANPRTVAHEVFHAVVRRSIGGGKLSDPELNAATVKMLEAIRRGGSKKMLSARSSLTGETVEDYIKRFSEDYDESERSEEQLSELAGILAENFMELDVNAKTAIKAWIGRMAEKLGINKALGTNIYSQEMTDKDAIDLLNTIAGKTAKGEIIKEAKTLQDIFRDEDASIEEAEGMASRYQKNPDIKRIAEQYIDDNGLERMEQLEVRSIDPEYSKKMADVYEAAEDMPNDPEVQKAYKALAEESKSQFDLLIDNGYSVEMFDGKGEPYANSKEMLADLKDNKRLVIFSTEEGFGESGITDEQRAANPMLADSGRVDANGKPMLLNDLFRFVHDAFGHGELGNGFGPIGEENAWYVHSQMFSPEARRAMTSETRGQNSWVNYGKHIRREDGSIPKRSDSDFVPLSERDFAPQKNFLFPDEYVFDNPNMSDAQRIQDNVEPMISDIKKVPFKDEGGATMNIDGTRYEGVGLATPVGSINTDQEAISPKSVSDFVSKNKAKISNDTFKIGLYKFPNSNKVSIDLNVVAPNENRQTALEIARMLGQESLFDLDTFENIKTGRDGMNPVELSDNEVAQLAESLAKNEVPEFLKAKFQKPIKATIDFKSRTGRSFSISKEFNNQQHLDNYIKFRERKGDKEVGVNIEEAKEVEAPKTQKRLFAKKAVINVGNNITGETTLEVGKIRPIMINGQEFARMTAIDIPQDNKFASTERDLYTRSVETAVSEGLGGLVIPRSVFNEIAVDESRFDVKKQGDEFVVTPKEGNAFTPRFQANYTNSVTGMTYVYDKNIDAWKKLEDIGRITKDKTVKFLQDKMVMIHAPDAAFSGEIQRNGETLVEGKGGLYFPIKFRDQNLVWASTRRAANKMAEQFNEMARSNGGKAYLVLTSAPYDKVLSSTIAANGVMDIFISKAVDRKVKAKKSDILRAIINAANKKEEVKIEGDNGKVSVKMVGLGLGLNKTSKFDDAISAIREKLDPDNSSFSDRKMFSETLAGEMADIINSLDDETTKFFFELFNNPQFKGKIAKGTGRYKASKANIIQGLSYMFAEPSLRPLLDLNIGGKKGVTGMAYAVIEAEGPFEAVEIEGHESYPVGIKGAGATNIHQFETPVKWTDFTVDPKTGKTIDSDKRSRSIMPPSAGISMTPLMVDASNVDVSDNEISLKFQNPTATAYTIHDAINELRGKGYTESAIALFISRQINPDTQKKYTKGEVTALLEIPVDIESTLPSAFGDVEGGVAQGQRMFTEVMEKVRRSAARMRPANSSKIRAKAHQILMAHPDFDKQSATVKNRLILGLDSALGTTANKAIQAEISAIKKMIKGGKISLKELKKAQVRLRAMIRKELPNDKAYSKTVVNNLIKMVTDATPETMDQVVKDVTSTINEQRSERFISEIEKILDQKFERTEAGRRKGAKVTATFADAIAFAKSKLAEIRKASENEDDFQTVMEKTRAERDALFSEIDTMTEEDISMVLAYDLVLQYGKTFVESNTEQDTVDGLELSLDMAKDLINTGRAFMKDQLRLAHEAYKEQFNTAFEDITGIDMRGMDEDQMADVSGSFRIGAEQRGKNLNTAAKAMMRVVDRANRFFAKNEDLAGFMDILSGGSGEMFGGKLQELVKQRVDDSSIVFKRGMMDMRAMVEAKQREIFGKGWKKVMANNRVPVKTGLTAFGKELTYSQNEMYYLYNMAKDPANHPSFEKKFGKEWREVMDGIEELMTPEIKEWADWQVNEFYPMMWERYNPVYRRIYRTNLGWNKFYAGKIYRQSIDGSEDIDLLEQKMGPSMSVAGGSTKHRVKNNIPIAAVDGNLAMGRYLEEMEKFRAYQETVRDVSKIFNNKDIKNAIIEKYGKDFHDLFSTMLERYLTGRMERGNLGSIVGTGNRVFIFSKLGYNLSLVWKQLTSIPTYANDIGFMKWGVYAAKAATSRKMLSKEMYENSTYLQDRYAGDFMGVVDVFSKNKENTMSVGAGADFYINEASDAVMRYGMLYTKAGDALAIFLGGSPNYLYYKDQFKKKNPNATEQEAINYAIKKFEKDTRGTQQSNDIQDRDFYQTGNEFMRSMMLFTTSPRQYWRKSMSGYRQLYRKMKGVPSKGSITDNLRTIVMYRFMMPMMYTWATMGFPAPWDLDDEEQSELMWSALLGNISALFMIGHIGIAVKDFMTDKPWAGRMPLPPIMQIASDMIDTMRSISKTKDPLERSIKEEEMYMKMVSNVVPSKNLDKSFGNWYRTATGDQDFNALKMAGYSDYIADRDERKMKEEMDALLKMFEKVNKGKGSDSREMKEIKELKEVR